MSTIHRIIMYIINTSPLGWFLCQKKTNKLPNMTEVKRQCDKLWKKSPEFGSFPKVSNKKGKTTNTKLEITFFMSWLQTPTLCPLGLSCAALLHEQLSISFHLERDRSAADRCQSSQPARHSGLDSRGESSAVRSFLFCIQLKVHSLTN